jgi:hypothetical protein
MKRLNYILMAGTLGSLLLSSSVFAGMDFIKYHDEFMAQKEEKTSPSEEKALQHTSKYLREQNPQKGTSAPTTEQGRPANKYDRKNWEPQQ